MQAGSGSSAQSNLTFQEQISREKQENQPPEGNLSLWLKTNLGQYLCLQYINYKNCVCVENCVQVLQFKSSQKNHRTKHAWLSKVEQNIKYPSLISFGQSRKQTSSKSCNIHMPLPLSQVSLSAPLTTQRATTLCTYIYLSLSLEIINQNSVDQFAPHKHHNQAETYFLALTDEVHGMSESNSYKTITVTVYKKYLRGK